MPEFFEIHFLIAFTILPSLMGFDPNMEALSHIPLVWAFLRAFTPQKT